MLNLNEVPKTLLGLQNHSKNPWNLFLQHNLTFSRMEADLGVPNT